METGISNFDSAKREYFFNIGLEMREALTMHRNAGLWDRVKGQRDFGNVTEHCLVEAARVEVLADLFGLSDQLKEDLRVAAALHDFFKKQEKEIVTKEGFSWMGFDISSSRATQLLEEQSKTDKGVRFSSNVIRLVNSVGHVQSSLLEVQKMLNFESLQPDQIAVLIMHYVDDYTVGSDWVPEYSEGSISPLDMRMNKNEANPRYSLLNEQGKEYFNGETTFQAQRRIGHLVEERLAKLLSEIKGTEVNKDKLPQMVDDIIRKKILGIAI